MNSKINFSFEHVKMHNRLSLFQTFMTFVVKQGHWISFSVYAKKKLEKK